jgi:hypothetical protein
MPADAHLSRDDLIAGLQMLFRLQGKNWGEAQHVIDAKVTEPEWYDFLNRVVKAKPFRVKRVMGFGLNAIGKALHAQGKIKTLWGDGPTDGLGVMVGAWAAAKQALNEGKPLREVELLRKIERYNEVDSRVLYEVIDFVRRG